VTVESELGVGSIFRFTLPDNGVRGNAEPGATANGGA